MRHRINHTVPPMWPLKFLRFFIKDRYLEEIEGDMEERFQDNLQRFSVRKARRLYVWDTLKLIRPELLKRITKSNQLSHLDMIRQNFKIAWRGLLKQKVFSFIKIGGFAIGIAACMLIGLFIWDELNYDKHYAKGDLIYRLVISYDEPGNTLRGVTLPAPVKDGLDNGFPEIEQSGRMILFKWFDTGDNQFRRADQVQNAFENGFVYADPEMLEILEIPMVYGEQSRALSEPNSMVISKRKADQYFPNQDPIGQTVILNDNESHPFTIGGVMEDFPAHSHLQHDFLITLSEKEFWPGSQTSWTGSNIYDVYVKLLPGADPRHLEKKLLSIRDNHIVVGLEKEGDQFAESVKKYWTLELQPVEEIYLDSDIRDFLTHGDIKVVWLFGSIAMFILILAMVNFINLSTAKSANRAKEVGLRKVVGSYRQGLVVQFMIESWVYSLISFGMGMLLAWLLLPSFNLLADKSLNFPWSEWWLFPISFGLAGVIGTLAGIYPAFYLSGFKPLEVLKGRLSMGSKSTALRSTMVVFQFTATIVLIICTLITYQQMDFILNKKIGYNKDQVVLLQGASTIGEHRAAFKNELMRMPEVVNVTQTDYMPISETRRDGTQVWKEGRAKIDIGIGCQFWQVDENYIETMGMELISGRGFSHDMASDSAAVIINQTLSKRLGFEDPIGERINVGRGTFMVVGVVGDFHFESMKGVIEPLAFVLSDYPGSMIAVRIETKDFKQSLASISDVWQEFMPRQPIRYTFLDYSYARMYADVERTGRVFAIFAILAIVVACLGLFALSAFMVEQRSKEISIRKVLGANFAIIIGLLTRDFLRLVLIALVIAVPAGWYLMDDWLADYAYSIDISWVVFVVAGAIAIAIALLTISSESIKAAMTNPSNKLRSE